MLSQLSLRRRITHASYMAQYWHVIELGDDLCLFRGWFRLAPSHSTDGDGLLLGKFHNKQQANIFEYIPLLPMIDVGLSSWHYWSHLHTKNPLAFCLDCEAVLLLFSLLL